MSMSGPAYCAPADVITLVTSYNAGGTFGDIATEIVQTAIYQASAKVSAWTNQSWGTNAQGQTVAPPDIIQSITLDIAAYYATLSYRKNKPIEANDPVLLRYNDAIADLKAIQEGQIDPNPQTPNLPVSRPGRVVNVTPPTFTPHDSGTTLERGRVTPESYPAPGSLGYGWW